MTCCKCGDPIKLEDIEAIGEFRHLCGSCAFRRMMSQPPTER